MEYTLDDLLEITENYLNTIDLSIYFDRGKTNVQNIADKLNADFSAGNLPDLPEALDGDIFKVFDLWDLTVYLRNRYNLQADIETIYTYWLSQKEG